MNPDVEALIQSLLRSSEPEIMERSSAMKESEPDPDFSQFQSKIAAFSYNPVPSQVERWVMESRYTDWLAKIREKWSQCEARIPALKYTFTGLFSPLLQIAENLSQQMQPAPVYRNAAVLERSVYRPRRRAAASAELPVMHPLFCTALKPAGGAIRLAGLEENRIYTFRFCCVQDASRQKELESTASPRGEIDVDLAAELKQLESDLSRPCELVWYLEEKSIKNNSPNWMSGLVWLEAQPTFDDIEEISRILLPTSREQRDDPWMNILIQINLFTVQELFIKAYETARHSLLFPPQTSTFSEGLPIKECLWQFIEWVIGKMAAKMQAAETAFQKLQPDWEGVMSLLVLKERIAARD